MSLLTATPVAQRPLFAMVSIAEEVAKELEEETYYRRSNEKDHGIQDSQRAHPGILKVFTPVHVQPENTAQAIRKLTCEQ